MTDLENLAWKSPLEILECYNCTTALDAVLESSRKRKSTYRKKENLTRVDNWIFSFKLES